MAVGLVDIHVRGTRIRAARIVGRDDLAAAAIRLGLERSPVVVLVLVGGAAHMAASDSRRVRTALADAVIPGRGTGRATVHCCLSRLDPEH